MGGKNAPEKAEGGGSGLPNRGKNLIAING